MTVRIPRAARLLIPHGCPIARVERMSRAFSKYHLNDGRALHRFRHEEPHSTPHDHPWSFETRILTGGYVEEVFHVELRSEWRSELVHRLPGTEYRIVAGHIPRIVGLPDGECWTLVRAGPFERTTRFWRFGTDLRSRAWNKRSWRVHR